VLSIKRSSLKGIVFLGMVWVILAAFFTQFAVAENENISISGTVLQDGKPQSGIIVYIDVNGDSIWNSKDEPHKNTSDDGTFNFNNITSGGFIRLQLDNSSYKSSPDGRKLSEFANGSNKLDFTIIPPITGPKSDSIENPKEGSVSGGLDSSKNGLSQNSYFLWLLVAVFLIISGFGCVVIYFGLKELYNLAKIVPTEKQKDSRIAMLILQIASGFILLLVGMSLLMNLAQMPGSATSGADVGEKMPYSIALPVLLALLLFGAVLAMLYAHTKLRGIDSESGGMRKTIAGLLVIGLIAVVLFALNEEVVKENENIITQYIQLVGIVIAFYFGSKATSEAYKGASEGDKGNAEVDLEVEKVNYDPQKDEIIFEMLNSKGRTFGVNTVKIMDGKDTLIEGAATGFGSESFKKIDVHLGLKQGEKEKLDKNKEYDFTIETTQIGSKKFKSKIDNVPAKPPEVPPAKPPEVPPAKPPEAPPSGTAEIE